jgi:hypothetical protein
MLIKQMVATETTQPHHMAGKVVWEEEALCLAKRTVLPVEGYVFIFLQIPTITRNFLTVLYCV